MPKAIHFLGALPRAGSTLLANILVQNPEMHATATSGVLSLVNGIRTGWERIPTFKAMDRKLSEAAKLRVMRGVIASYFGDVKRSVVLDKSRAWIGNIPLAEALLGKKAKIIAPVRDVRDIVASFEKLVQKNVLKPTMQELGSAANWSTVEGRVDIWMGRNGVVGSPYRHLRELLVRGFADRLIFVDYDHLTRDPESQMRRIYEFLGMPHFKHDFQHVKQVTSEDDEVWAMPGLHDIRPEVKPQPPIWPKFLPKDVASKIPARQLWEKLTPPLPAMPGSTSHKKKS